MSVKIQISYKELTDTKQLLDTQPRQRIIFSEDTKRLLLRDITPYKETNKKHSNNHGILIIPKINSILRCENAKPILRRSSSNSTIDNWLRFNQCAAELDLCRQKECAPISIPKAKSLR